MTDRGRASTGRAVFGKDFFWGSAVSLVVLAAVFGTFMVEQDQVGSFAVTWQFETMELGEWPGSVEQEGAAARHGFTVQEPDALVMHLDFKLAWDAPSMDRFRLEITSPNGTVSGVEQQGGQLEHRLRVHDGGGLAGQVFFADDGAHALALAWEQIDDENRTAADGEWSLAVELSEGVRELAPGVEDPMATVANDYRLEATLTVMRPHV